MGSLTCPVCRNAMRESKRNGILIDTCTSCRGVWLDRGELEKLAGQFDADHDGRSRPDRSDDWRPEQFRDRADDRRFGGPKSKVSNLLDFFD